MSTPEKFVAGLAKQEIPVTVPTQNAGETLYKTNMKAENQTIVLKAISEAFEKKNEPKDIAEYIKENVQKKISGEWSCILGKDFSSNVDFIGHFLYTHVNGLGVLLFSVPK